MHTIHRAFREALLALPAEEYDWFDIADDKARGRATPPRAGLAAPGTETSPATQVVRKQREFYEFPGPLFSVTVSPASCIVAVNTSRTLRAIPRDRARRLVEENLTYHWEITEGTGTLANAATEIVTFHAPAEPGLTRLRLRATQGATTCDAEALVTVAAELVAEPQRPEGSRQGLPSYTFERLPGELWRSRYEEARNLIVINNGHRDFVFAARQRALKLRYLCRLYVKELVQKNFPGLPADRLLERMVELSLYTEENLK